jgi:hypothetical protein
VHEAAQEATLVLDTQPPGHWWLPARHCTAVAVAVLVAVSVPVTEPVAVVVVVLVAVSVAMVVAVAEVTVAVSVAFTVTVAVAVAVSVAVTVVLVAVAVPVDVKPPSGLLAGASMPLGPSLAAELEEESAASDWAGSCTSGRRVPQATTVSPARASTRIGAAR